MWLTILRFLIALPGLWSMVREIIDLIKGLPKDEQAEAKGKLVEIAKQEKAGTMQGDSKQKLESMREELRQRVGRK